MHAHEIETANPGGSINSPVVTRFLRLPDVMKMIGLGRSKIYQMIKSGEFPRPRKLGRRVSVWLLEEVQLWMEERMCLQ